MLRPELSRTLTVVPAWAMHSVVKPAAASAKMRLEIQYFIGLSRHIVFKKLLETELRMQVRPAVCPIYTNSRRNARHAFGHKKAVTCSPRSPEPFRRWHARDGAGRWHRAAVVRLRLRRVRPCWPARASWRAVLCLRV